MNLFTLSWKNLLHRKTLTILTVLAVSVATALIVFIFLVNDGLSKNVGKGYGPFQGVVGAEGSASQLILNTFYHVGAPTGNIDYELYEELAENRFVDMAIPMTRGDSYKGSPIVGVPSDYLSIRYPEAVLQDGTIYKSAGEVVAGSYAAEQLGLEVGDEFHGEHGVTETAGSHEEFTFKIAGILPKLGTPDDKALFTTLDTAWLVHEDHAGEEAESGTEAEHHEGEITAILIKPKGIMDVAVIKANYDELDGVQVAYSGKETANILSIVDTGAGLVKIIAFATVIVAAISILLSLSAMAAERKKDIGLLRLIGKPKSYIMASMMAEANLLTISGILLGILMGHAGTYFLQDLIFSYAGINLAPFTPILAEVYLLIGGILLCTAVTLVPAIRSYRVDPVQLFQT